MKKLEKDYGFLESMKSCQEYRDCYLILRKNVGKYVSIHDDMHFGLNKACFRGYLPLVKYFLEDFESYFGLHFSLYNATKSGSVNVIRFLITHKNFKKGNVGPSLKYLILHKEVPNREEILSIFNEFKKAYRQGIEAASRIGDIKLIDFYLYERKHKSSKHIILIKRALIGAIKGGDIELIKHFAKMTADYTEAIIEAFRYQNKEAAILLSSYEINWGFVRSSIINKYRYKEHIEKIYELFLEISSSKGYTFHPINCYIKYKN